VGADRGRRRKNTLKVKDRVTVKAPGSIANLGPGFDVFAIALKAPSDLLTIELTREEGVRLNITGFGSDTIPSLPEENTAGLVARCLLDRYDLERGVRLTIRKGIRPGFGLGSSGADAAATAFALDHLLDLGLSDNELVELAAQGEYASSNSAHADNVSASLLGGFTVVRSYDPMDVLSYQAPDDLGICVTTPDIEPPPKKTAISRQSLPDKVSLDQLTHNVGHASSLVYGMITKDIELIGEAMDDRIIEPVRAQSIPGYRYVKEGAIKRGAVGVALCGAGPSIAAFYDAKRVRPEPILEGMAHGFRMVGLGYEQLVTTSGGGVEIFTKERVLEN
jgi:homoserine kinase